MEKSLQTLNYQEKIAVWSERIAACRSSSISIRAYSPLLINVKKLLEGNSMTNYKEILWLHSHFLPKSQKPL